MLKMKGMRFQKEVILLSIRWYAAYPLSYHNPEEMMHERGVKGHVDKSGASKADMDGIGDTCCSCRGSIGKLPVQVCANSTLFHSEFEQLHDAAPAFVFSVKGSSEFLR